MKTSFRAKRKSKEKMKKKFEKLTGPKEPTGPKKKLATGPKKELTMRPKEKTGLTKRPEKTRRLAKPGYTPPKLQVTKVRS